MNFSIFEILETLIHIFVIVPPAVTGPLDWFYFALTYQLCLWFLGC